MHTEVLSSQSKFTKGPVGFSLAKNVTSLLTGAAIVHTQLTGEKGMIPGE